VGSFLIKRTCRQEKGLICDTNKVMLYVWLIRVYIILFKDVFVTYVFKTRVYL